MTDEKTINIECIFCGEIIQTPITEADLDNYHCFGQPIQVTLAHIPPEFREMLMTGICPVCWDKTIKDMEGEEYKTIKDMKGEERRRIIRGTSKTHLV